MNAYFENYVKDESHLPVVNDFVYLCVKSKSCDMLREEVREIGYPLPHGLFYDFVGNRFWLSQEFCGAWERVLVVEFPASAKRKRTRQRV